jgi:hypothetical protein
MFLNDLCISGFCFLTLIILLLNYLVLIRIWIFWNVVVEVLFFLLVGIIELLYKEPWLFLCVILHFCIIYKCVVMIVFVNFIVRFL